MEQDLVKRLRIRAEIRRQIPHRKSIQEGKPDRLADLLDEAADEIERFIEMNIPEGWPTEEMIEAGKNVLANEDYPTHFICESELGPIFSAMLAAAPTPRVPKIGPVAWMIEIEVTRGVIQRIFHGHNAIDDYRKSFPDATSRPLYTTPIR